MAFNVLYILRPIQYHTVSYQGFLIRADSDKALFLIFHVVSDQQICLQYHLQTDHIHYYMKLYIYHFMIRHYIMNQGTINCSTYDNNYSINEFFSVPYVYCTFLNPFSRYVCKLLNSDQLWFHLLWIFRLLCLLFFLS